MKDRWTKRGLEWYLDELKKDDIHEIASTLFIASKHHSYGEYKPLPTGNAQIVSHLEALVKNRGWVMVYRRIPPRYGELRWLAARILACEYAYLGIETPIILEDVPVLMSEAEFKRICLQNRHLERPWRYLIDNGLWETTTEIIKPQDYCDWCSKEAIEERRRNNSNE